MHRRHLAIVSLGVLVGVGVWWAVNSNPAPSEADLFELRLVEDVPTEGSQQAMLDDEILNLAPMAMVSDADVRAVVAEIQPSGLLLSIDLTDEGRGKLLRATAENIGRRMAVILDGRVRSAPVIRASIPGGPVQVSVEASQSEAESLATKIRSRW